MRSYFESNFAFGNFIVVGKCLNLLDFEFEMLQFEKQGYGSAPADELAVAAPAAWELQAAGCWRLLAEVVPGMLAALMSSGFVGCDGRFAGFADEICYCLGSPNYEAAKPAFV